MSPESSVRCRLPGCAQLVQQPSSGGRPKRFCCDAHRLQFWRQTRGERPRSEGDSSGASPVQALRQELQQAQTALALCEKSRLELVEEVQRLREREAQLSSKLTASEEFWKTEFAAFAERQERAQERLDRVQERLEQAHQELRSETESRAKAEQQAADAERRVQEQREDSATARRNRLRKLGADLGVE